jgi:hypothetical protein
MARNWDLPAKKKIAITEHVTFSGPSGTTVNSANFGSTRGLSGLQVKSRSRWAERSRFKIDNAQNTNFSPSWIWRDAVTVLDMTPQSGAITPFPIVSTLEKAVLPLGTAKFG